jgi:hypothetical protein
VNGPPAGRAVLPRRERRRRRRNTVLLVAAVMLGVVALAGAAGAFVVRSATSDLRARAVPIDRRRRELAANEHHAESRLGLLRDRSAVAASRLAELLTAYQAQVDASNHAVDVANQAVDRYNRGEADVAAAFQGAGDAAVADLEQKTASVTAAVTAAQQALAALEQAAGG